MHIFSPAFMGSPLLIALICSPGVQAGSGGIVNMKGSIVDTPCAIDTGSLDQTIDMASRPVSDLVRDGAGAPQPFRIQLTDCHTSRVGSTREDWHQFTVTFDGAHDGQLFGVRGGARGVGLKILDSQGRQAIPGEPLPARPLIPGDASLYYTLQLAGDHHVLHVGQYASDIRFRLDYY
jgi:type 1 fimbria pilin